MRYNPELNPEYIYIVGVGGTGSHIATTAGRMLYDMRQRRLQVPQLVLVDPDHVEPKNVGRQLFAPQDVGQPKAAIIARRLNFFMGIDATYHVAPFAPEMLPRKHYRSRPNGIIIGAVDGHEGRTAISETEYVIWIDAGNHFDSGQVVIGDTGGGNVFAPGNWREDEDFCRHLPTAADLYPALLEPPTEAEPQVSCADLMQQGDQHLLINQMMATVATNYLYKLLHQLPITSYRTHVDLELGIMKPMPITRQNLASDLNMEGATA